MAKVIKLSESLAHSEGGAAYVENPFRIRLAAPNSLTSLCGEGKSVCRSHCHSALDNSRVH
jgi:hypothetical protein